MQSKPIAAIIVLLLVVAFLLVAGCTTSTTSNTNQTPTPSTVTHDAFLEKFLAAFKKNRDLDKNYSTNAWDVTWINDTSARLDYTYKDTNGTIKTTNDVVIFTAFPTTQDATNYLNAMNKTGYSLVSTICTGGSTGPYQDAAGHAPQICKIYQWIGGNYALNSSEYREYHIWQMDNIIMDVTAKYLD